METPDKYTLRVHTKQPSASLLAGMAGGWSSIIPKEVVEEKGDLRRTAVGTGPFIFQEWVPQSHLKARRNPDYWDKGKPYVDALELRVIPDEANIIAQLRTGNVHHALLEDNKNYLLVKDDKRLTALRAPAARLRHGHDQPRAEALHRRPGAPGDQPGRRPERGAPGGGLRTRLGDGTAHAGHEALGAARSRRSRSGTRRTPSARRSCWPTPGFPQRLQDDAQGDPDLPDHGGGGPGDRRPAQEGRHRRPDRAGGVRGLDQGHHQAELRLRPDHEHHDRRRRSRTRSSTGASTRSRSSGTTAATPRSTPCSTRASSPSTRPSARRSTTGSSA